MTLPRRERIKSIGKPDRYTMVSGRVVGMISGDLGAPFLPWLD